MDTKISHKDTMAQSTQRKDKKIISTFFLSVSVVSLCLCVNVFADDFSVTGDIAIAERYLLWAEDAIAAGQWSQARAALERAMDFAGVSSDISYLLAVVLSHENENRELILQTVEMAIGTKQWERYNEAQAQLFAAELLVTLRQYNSALNSIAIGEALYGKTVDFALLRLAALKGLAGDTYDVTPVQAEFHRCMFETLERYPRDPRPLRIFFAYASENPDDGDIALMELALSRVPFLLELDPELAWMAAPFIGDDDEARRFVAAYRAGSYQSRPDGFKPNPASIVPALNLGLLDDMDAVEELFTPNGSGELVLDKDIIINIGDLLRSDEGRDSLVEHLLSFTGSITGDEDRDGYPESRAVYLQGSLREYYCDTNQNGRTSLFIRFDSGAPQWGEFTVLPMRNYGGEKVSINWERYPSVQTAELGTEVYRYAPGGFLFAPVRFVELCASNTYAGLLYPQRDPATQNINRRMLASFAASIQRPSADFEGGHEHIFLDKGIPVRAEDTINGKVVSITEFENGRPVVRYMDIDLDGIMETVLRFRNEE